MVQFPGYGPYLPMNSGEGYTVSRFGNPRVITPVIGSPRLIADFHVLHRHLLARHPPCALNILTTHTFVLPYAS